MQKQKACAEQGKSTSRENRSNDSLSIAHRATGPRTTAGKRRSSRNAVKHGIFSKAILTDGESRRQYEALLEGFREQFQPVGAAEELLVQKLVMVSLRHRRLLIAESAEIRQRTQFMEWDQRMKDAHEVSEAMGVHNMNFEGQSPMLVRVGLVHKTENPLILEKCINLLSELRERAEKNGFDQDRDSKVMALLHGGPVGLYKQYLHELQQAEDERARGEQVSSPLNKQDELQGLDDDLRSLIRMRLAQAEIEEERAELKRLCLGVPESPKLDCLMRYEAHLSREFDRILNQIERVQRMRRGQPGPRR